MAARYYILRDLAWPDALYKVVNGEYSILAHLGSNGWGLYPKDSLSYHVEGGAEISREEAAMILFGCGGRV